MQPLSDATIHAIANHWALVMTLLGCADAAFLVGCAVCLTRDYRRWRYGAGR